MGLLVTPNRLVLKPGERKLVRIAVIEPAATVERIYRITGKPPDLDFQRHGRRVIVTNNGNTNALLTEGRQCDAACDNCVDLPSKHLFVGGRWELELETDSPAEYYVSSSSGISVSQFWARGSPVW